MLKLKTNSKPYNGDPGADRDKFIGGSETASILGANPYCSAYTLWLQKTKQIEPEDISDKLQVFLGNELENAVAKRFEFETGKKVQRSNKTFFLEEYPFICAHIDRKIVGEKTGLECKTMSHRNPTDFANGDIYAPHWIQCQHYMLVTNTDHWYYAVLRDNYEFHILKVDRNDDFIENTMLPALVDFWKHVQDGTPPEIDGSDSTSESIDFSRSEKDLRSDEQVTVLGKDVAHALKEADEIKAQIKTLTELVKTYENNAKVAMEDYQKATAGNYELSYKPISSMRLDSKKLKEEKPDIYNQYAKESVSNRFTYKLRKEK